MKQYGEAQSGEFQARRFFYDNTIEQKINRRERKKMGALNFV